MNATALLREEHRLILRVTDAFEKLLDRPAGALPLDAISDCIDFYRLFTDACHHGKEEDLLFVAMEEEAPGAEGPIAVMREEHVYGRRLAGRMAVTVQRLRAGEDAAERALMDDGREYIDFIRAHIRKEDEGVFEIADDLIRGGACSSLCAAYETVCSRRFDGRSLADLETLAARIIAG